MMRPGWIVHFPRSLVRGLVVRCALVASLSVLLVPDADAGLPGLSGGASPGGSDLMLVRTASLQTRGVLTVRVAGEYFESQDAAEFRGEEAAGRYTTLCAGASYGLTTWLEVSARVPVRRAVWGDGASPDEVAGLDSPVIGVKVGAPVDWSVLSFAVDGRVGLPVGSELKLDGEAADGFHLTGGSDTDWEVALLATADFTDWLPLRLHANVGWAHHGNEVSGRRFFPDYYPAVPEGGDPGDNDAVILRGAVEFPGRKVDLFTEFRGDILNGRDLVALKENPLTIMPGVRVRFGSGWSATGGLSISISGDDRDTPDFDPHNAYPDWGVRLMVGYAWPVFAADTDGDGIPDFRDGCPKLAEDMDGFLDDDGCPDPDNDADGVPDGFDGRPLLMEDYDGFEDEDGVPDLDNDGDGIVDERDMCPDEAEDLDGFEDGDGCPDD
jgi:hypothetical protein